MHPLFTDEDLNGLALYEGTEILEYLMEITPPRFPDNSRLDAFTRRHTCLYFDGISIPRAIALVSTVPELLNDDPCGWTKENLDDLTGFIIEANYKLRHSLDHMFHYSVFYLLQNLALISSNEIFNYDHHRKPSFTPATSWTGRDTYFAAFLWVASVYDNPEREQQPPTWQEFSLVSGLTRYEQWQYFQYMHYMMLEHKELVLKVTRMVRHGFMQELPVKMGESWWEQSLKVYHHEERFRTIRLRRAGWSQRRLPERVDGTVNEQVLDKLLPDERRPFSGIPKVIKYHGPAVAIQEQKSCELEQGQENLKTELKPSLETQPELTKIGRVLGDYENAPGSLYDIMNSV